MSSSCILANLLVTGGTGQIGSFLCDELVNRENTVLCYDTRASADILRSPTGRIRTFVGDVTDFDGLLEVSRLNSIDCIIHLAALLVLESKEHPSRSYRTNILGTNNVMEVARLLDIAKIIFASSVTVYGLPKTKTRGVADEDDIPDVPCDPYSTSKAAAELMGRFYRDTYGLDITCLRLAGAWGPGRYSGYTGQFNDFIRRVAVDESARIPEDFAYTGAKLRWLYVKDVGRCFAHAAESSRPKGYLYNTGSERPFNASEVVRILRSLFPAAEIELTRRDEPTELSRTVAGPNGLDVDCSRLYRELGFEPRFDLNSAVKDMVDLERSKLNLSPL